MPVVFEKIETEARSEKMDELIHQRGEYLPEYFDRLFSFLV